MLVSPNISYKFEHQTSKSTIDEQFQLHVISCRSIALTALRDHPRAPGTNTMHAMTACSQFDHPLIIGFGNSMTGYEIILVIHPYIYNIHKKCNITS